MNNVLTIGDAMITFNPQNTGPLRFVQDFSRSVGGAELNFAVGCARLQLKSTWVSRLGNDEFGKVIYNFARGEGIQVQHVKLVDGFPTSVNFKETQESGANRTFYYRYNTPIAALTPEQITDALLDGVSLVHITGVFLAILPKNIDIIMCLLIRAQAKKIPISFDPNLRLKLWTIEEARAVFEKIYPFVDILLTGREELELLLPTIDHHSLENFVERFAIQELVIKDGINGSKLLVNGGWYEQPAFKVRAVDTVGAGDGFDAGYIYSYLHHYQPEKKLQFANAVGAFVTTVVGDNEGLPELEQVMAFINQEKIIER